MKILCFGIAKDIVGASEIQAPSGAITSVEKLRRYLEDQFSEFKNISQYMVAINESYANDNQAIRATDHIAIIPPVSGG